MKLKGVFKKNDETEEICKVCVVRCFVADKCIPKCKELLLSLLPEQEKKTNSGSGKEKEK